MLRSRHGYGARASRTFHAAEDATQGLLVVLFARCCQRAGRQCLPAYKYRREAISPSCSLVSSPALSNPMRRKGGLSVQVLSSPGGIGIMRYRVYTQPWPDHICQVNGGPITNSSVDQSKALPIQHTLIIQMQMTKPTRSALLSE